MTGEKRQAWLILFLEACGWQLKLCDPSLTHAIPKCFRDEYHTQYKALYKRIVQCTVLTVLYLHTSLVASFQVNRLRLFALKQSARVYRS